MKGVCWLAMPALAEAKKFLNSELPMQPIFNDPPEYFYFSMDEFEVCIRDLDTDMDLFSGMWMVKIQVEKFYNNEDDHVKDRWLRSSDMAERCVSAGHAMWQAKFGGNAFGACVPQSCSNEWLAEQAVNRIMALNLDHYEPICHATGCFTTGVKQLGLWRHMHLHTAIVGFPRSGTTAMLDHLLSLRRVGNNNSVIHDNPMAFDSPGSNPVRINATSSTIHVGEDVLFGYNSGFMMFPLQDQVDAFNAENEVLAQYRAENGFSAGRFGKVVIKNPDYLAAWWTMQKFLHMPTLKYIIQISDVMRWFDYEMRRSTEYALVYPDQEKYDIFCEPRYHKNGQLELRSVIECIPGLLEKTLTDDSGYANLPEAMGLIAANVDRDRIFFLHKDWLDHDSAAAMRSLEAFLEVPQWSLGKWPERTAKVTKWKTDICTTPIYEQVKAQLEAQFPLVMEYLQQQSHWIPPSMSQGRSACDQLPKQWGRFDK